MLAKRLVPCLDIKDGMVVKGTKFKDIKTVDDPVTLAKIYSDVGADELVFYDISASHEGRGTFLDIAKNVAENISIPFTIGGGIRTVDDFDAALKAGADKISINSSAVKNPQLIKEASLRFGAQCVVLSMDVLQTGDNKWEVVVNGGRIKTGMDAIEWAIKGENLGAGELVINSIDSDGVKDGYDIPLLKAIREVVQIPIIASGGAGTMEHFKDVFQESNVDAALAASVFHFGEIEIKDLKKYLQNNNIEMRL